MPSDSPEVKELYQRLSHKISYVARSITEKVQATTQAWNQPISLNSDELNLDDLNQLHNDKISQVKQFIKKDSQTTIKD